MSADQRRPTAKVDKPCEDCGVLMVDVAPMQKYCPVCAKKRVKKNKASYRDRKADKQYMSPISNENAKYCKGCYYWGGVNVGSVCCNYIFYEDRKRPCPPGKGCTEKRRKRI